VTGGVRTVVVGAAARTSGVAVGCFDVVVVVCFDVVVVCLDDDVGFGRAPLRRATPTCATSFLSTIIASAMRRSSPVSPAFTRTRATGRRPSRNCATCRSNGDIAGSSARTPGESASTDSSFIMSASLRSM
jgi:hypothetical protein